MKIHNFLLLLVILTVTACQNNTTVRYHSNYGHVLQKEGGFTLLPPSVEVNTDDAAGKVARQYDFEYFLEPIINEEVKELLQTKGYRVSELKKKQLKQNKLYKDSSQLKSRFSDQLQQMYALNQQDKKIAFNRTETVGKIATNISKVADSNLLVLTKYNEYVKTTGHRVRDFTMDLLVGVATGGLVNPGFSSAAAERATFVVGIVDARDGKILWVNNAFDRQDWISSGLDSLQSNDVIARDKIKRLLKKSLEKLPHKDKLIESMKKEAAKLKKG